MKKITYLLLCASMVLAMSSCAKMQADRQISSLEALIEKVEKDGDSFTKEDWTDVANEFDEICGKMAQYDYTDEQMKEIARLKGRFYGACTKKAVKSAGGLLNGLLQQAGGAVDGFLEGLDLSDDGESAAISEEQLEEQVDEILQGLESMFE